MRVAINNSKADYFRKDKRQPYYKKVDGNACGTAKNYAVVVMAKSGSWPTYESVIYECNDIRNAQNFAEQAAPYYDRLAILDRDFGFTVAAY